MAVRRNAIGQKTYWHLLEARRVPSRYEIATSRLLWRPSVGVAVRTPVTAWSEAHPGGLRGSAEAWETFVDPAQLTYGAYVQQRAERECHVDQLPADDAALAPAWIASLGAALGPLRFPRHGLMMAVSFAGSMAPSGRIAVACAFHAGDAIRHVERLADRLVQLRTIAPTCGDDARARWLDAPRSATSRS